MNRTLAFLAIAILGLAACTSSDRLPPIKGRWAVDMEKTLQRAEDMGASIKTRANIMEQLQGGLMEVTDSELILSLRGNEGLALKLPYSVNSVTKDCANMDVTIGKKVHAGKFCIVNGYLEATSGLSPTVEIFRRAS